MKQEVIFQDVHNQIQNGIMKNETKPMINVFQISLPKGTAIRSPTYNKEFRAQTQKFCLHPVLTVSVTANQKTYHVAQFAQKFAVNGPGWSRGKWEERRTQGLGSELNAPLCCDLGCQQQPTLTERFESYASVSPTLAHLIPTAMSERDAITLNLPTAKLRSQLKSGRSRI